MANESILIVDDNPMNVKLLKLLLDVEGYRVKTAADSNETLNVLQEFHPKLILMDLNLPGMDGLELTRRLKADPQKRDILILMVTSFVQKGEEQKAIQAGCDGYLSKPIDTQKLPLIIAEYLRRKS